MNMKFKRYFNHNVLASTVLMLSVTNAGAVIINMSYQGAFTLVSSTGAVVSNPDFAGGTGLYDDAFGVRSTLTGSMTFDTVTGAYTVTVAPFLLSGTLMTIHDFTMQAIGDGIGGPGTLIMSSMLVDTACGLGDCPTNEIAYMISDASGLMDALSGGVFLGEVISGIGVTSSTEAHIALSPFGSFVDSLGLVPIAMTTLDVNQDGDGWGGGNLCGTAGSVDGVLGTGALINGGFPLCDDGVTGVRNATNAFFWGPGQSGNIDFGELTVVTSVVPVPAAVWLFGSGLLGLIGVAKRKARA